MTSINSSMELIVDYWDQILILVGAVIIAVRLESEVKSLRKDLQDVTKRDTYVETVKLRAELDVVNNQVTALWRFVNDLRDRFSNGHK